MDEACSTPPRGERARASRARRSLHTTRRLFTLLDGSRPDARATWMLAYAPLGAWRAPPPVPLWDIRSSPLLLHHGCESRIHVRCHPEWQQRRAPSPRLSQPCGNDDCSLSTKQAAFVGLTATGLCASLCCYCRAFAASAFSHVVSNHQFSLSHVMALSCNHRIGVGIIMPTFAAMVALYSRQFPQKIHVQQGCRLAYLAIPGSEPRRDCVPPPLAGFALRRRPRRTSTSVTHTAPHVRPNRSLLLRCHHTSCPAPILCHLAIRSCMEVEDRFAASAGKVCAGSHRVRGHRACAPPLWHLNGCPGGGGLSRRVGLSAHMGDDDLQRPLTRLGIARRKRSACKARPSRAPRLTAQEGRRPAHAAAPLSRTQAWP